MQNSDNTIFKPVRTFKGKPARAFSFLVILLLSAQLPAFAQLHDIGLGIGASNYTGDLERTYSLRTHRPAGWAFYRYNLNNAMSFRGSLSAGWLTGSDRPPHDAFAARRNREPFNVIVTEIAATFEYNFLDYKNPKSHLRWSPYFFGGISAFTIFGYTRSQRVADYRRFQPAIPVGIGAKYRISPNLTLGAEWGARKTFFDYIDNTGEFIRDETGGRKTYQYGNVHHKDWYYFTGITLSYTIWTIPCPFLID